jgi:hypothetical protein
LACLATGSSARPQPRHKALGYAAKQEAGLRRILDDGDLSLDNTRAESASKDRRRAQGMDVLWQ